MPIEFATQIRQSEGPAPRAPRDIFEKKKDGSGQSFDQLGVNICA